MKFFCEEIIRLKAAGTLQGKAKELQGVVALEVCNHFPSIRIVAQLIRLDRQTS
jgi:hypothetical protein